jgi:hypothetical protein
MAGPAGPTGPSGVIAVRDFEADWTQDMTGGTVVFPALCRTTAYTPTTANEVALISMQGTIAPNPAGDFIFLAPAASQNGGAMGFVSGWYNIDGMTDGAGSVSTSRRFPLTQGVSYVFGAGFQTQGDVTVVASTCHGVVTIVRQ